MLKKYALLIIIVLILDQLLKIWVKTNMFIGDSIPIFGNWAFVHFVENEGMAFGWKLFGGGDFGKIFLSVFRIAAVIGIAYYLWIIIKQKKHFLLLISISLIFAGALGNIIDSLFYGLIFEASTPFHVASMFPADGGYANFLHGRVVDMFYFPLFEGSYPKWIPWIGGDYYQFFQPVFNIADSSIFIGVSMLVIMQKKFFANEEEY
ncbi:MAG: lipoprotein signal peptidase [Bacteroidetes bacterium]|nr:MAG: lipoprotein signal peptidase [Bacteroidota bacterium]